MEEIILKGKRCYLRPLTLNDVTQDYVTWMNDKNVTRFLETRFILHTHKSIQDYVQSILKNPDDVFMAICVNGTNQHIGNIKLGPINRQHLFAHIGLMIGDKDYWGKGYATEAIGLISQYAFETLKLNKVMAGCYANNVGSMRAFEKAGFYHEGIEKSKWLCEGQYVDGILLSLLNLQGKNNFNKI